MQSFISKISSLFKNDKKRLLANTILTYASKIEGIYTICLSKGSPYYALTSRGDFFKTYYYLLSTVAGRFLDASRAEWDYYAEGFLWLVLCKEIYWNFLMKILTDHSVHPIPPFAVIVSEASSAPYNAAIPSRPTTAFDAYLRPHGLTHRHFIYLSLIRHRLDSNPF